MRQLCSWALYSWWLCSLCLLFGWHEGSCRVQSIMGVIIRVLERIGCFSCVLARLCLMCWIGWGVDFFCGAWAMLGADWWLFPFDLGFVGAWAYNRFVALLVGLSCRRSCCGVVATLLGLCVVSFFRMVVYHEYVHAVQSKNFYGVT